MTTKISSLGAASSLDGTEITAVVQSSTTKRTTLQVIADWIVKTSTSFAQSGTGAVSQTVSQSLQNKRLNIYDYIPTNLWATVQAGTNTTDLSTYVQAWLDAMRTNKRAGEAPAGTFKIATGLTFTTAAQGAGLDFYGDGIGATIFDNQVASGPMLYVDGGTSSVQRLGMELDGITILTTTSPASSIGLQMRGQWFARAKRIKINGLSSDAIKIIDNLGDPDASAYLDFDQIFLQSNGGFGLNCPNASTTAISNALLSISRSDMRNNTSGGLRLLGAYAKVWLSAFSNNGGPGITLPYDATSTAPQGIDIDQCEFDGNGTYHIDVQAASQGKVRDSKFVYSANLTGIRIGDGGAGSVITFLAERNHHRRSAGTVTIHSVGSNASDTRITDNYYPSLTGVTTISDSGTRTVIRQDSAEINNIAATTTTSAASPYTPNVGAGGAIFHRIVVTAATYTINAPTGFADGKELELCIFNANGAGITVTFDAAFQKGGYTDPAAGKFRTCKFRYHAISTVWMQIGAWSADL